MDLVSQLSASDAEAGGSACTVPFKCNSLCGPRAFWHAICCVTPAPMKEWYLRSLWQHTFSVIWA